MKEPVTGRISSRFGTRIHPITSVHSFHNGVDIAVPVGTTVVAPEYGLITEVWDHPKGGICMAMMSTSGRRYGFAHLSKRLVMKDTPVAEGDPIAETGSTGLSTGPHLHFTVKVGSHWKDPLNYFTFSTPPKCTRGF